MSEVGPEDGGHPWAWTAAVLAAVLGLCLYFGGRVGHGPPEPSPGLNGSPLPSAVAAPSGLPSVPRATGAPVLAPPATPISDSPAAR